MHPVISALSRLKHNGIQGQLGQLKTLFKKKFIFLKGWECELMVVSWCPRFRLCIVEQREWTIAEYDSNLLS